VFLRKIKSEIIKIITDLLEKHINLKFNCYLICKYILLKDEDEWGTQELSHQTKMTVLYSYFSQKAIGEEYDKHCNSILAKMSEFQERDSGWSLVEISHMDVNINKYEPIRGSKYIY